ncbi:hypothetical protein ABLE91_17785 [Aquabacter sp. CN5-332]|uniref:hypothetical protein n=1 Tax=Aquabacter sp. CN5-332 TaxID=3156608 RepID=UPI0032B4F995
MKTWLSAAVIAGTLAVAAPAMAQSSAQTAMPAANWLFVQAADSATVDGSKLVLKGVAPQTVMFADRPERMTGDTTTASFVKLWTDGKDSFQKDPPNATLSVTVDGKSQVSVVELSDPVLSGDTLTYNIKVLSNEKPVSGQAASLFIDWWYGGPGRCWRGPYGGLHCGW